jgi:hypothetical protein
VGLAERRPVVSSVLSAVFSVVVFVSERWTHDHFLPVGIA